MIYSIINISAIIFEAITTFMFFEHFLSRKSSNQWIRLLSGILFFVLVYISNYLIKTPVIMALTSMGIFYITAMFFKDNIKRKTFIILGYMILILISETITVLIMVIADSSVHELMEDNNMKRMVGTVISKIIVLCLIKLVCVFSDKTERKIYRNYWLALLTVPAANICLLLAIITFLYDINKSISVPILAAVVSILYTTILVFYLFDKVMGLTGKCRMLGEQIIFQSDQYEKEKDEAERIRSIKHDFKNHFQVLYKMLYYNRIDNAKKYLTDLNILGDIKENAVDTGNISIDSIISTKECISKSKDIKMNVSMLIPENMQMDSIDECTLIGNLLDNAIEACERTIDRPKIINMKLEYRGNYLMCNVENTAPLDVKIQNNSLVSSKTDLDKHGIGHKNIQKVVDKYNGISKMYVKNGMFKVEILLFI